MPDTQEKWYVVHTKPRQETVAEEHIARQAYVAYLPRIKCTKHHRGQWQNVVEPLFPRYLFVRINPDVSDISPLRSTRGVVGLVRFGDKPMPVPDEVIEALRNAEDENEDVYIPDEKPFCVGDKVRITEGPLMGLEGIYTADTGEQRAMLLLDIVGRENRVYITKGCLEKAS